MDTRATNRTSLYHPPHFYSAKNVLFGAGWQYFVNVNGSVLYTHPLKYRFADCTAFVSWIANPPSLLFTS